MLSIETWGASLFWYQDTRREKPPMSTVDGITDRYYRTDEVMTDIP